jgi:cytosine/adenosine deaminase-related metal-dependent hydrolase
MLPITNAHTHLELTDLAHLCPAEPMPFVSWILQLVRHQRRRSKAQIQASIARGIAELQAHGTTYVGDITATWQSVEPLLASDLRGVVYLEVLGLDRKRALERLEQAKATLRRARARPDYGRVQAGLSLHAPYSCHPDLLRAGAAWCRAEGMPLCVHVAESPVETELLLRGRAPSVPWYIKLAAKAWGAWPSYVPRMRPIPYLASLGVLDARPLLVHAIHVTDEDIRTIADAGCAVVHCPRSNARLSCGRMPLERYLAAGIPVYLGTDSRASSPSLDVRAEADFAQGLHAGVVEPKKVAELVHRTFPCSGVPSILPQFPPMVERSPFDRLMIV